MTITVNGKAIDEAAIAAEAKFHRHAPSPERSAACALAIRELLLQRACEAGLVTSVEADDEAACDAAIERLLACEAPVPEPSEAECRKYYDTHPIELMSGELVEAAHILFAVTPNAPVDAIRRQAEAVLREALAAPECFAELAQRFSNCPSAAQAGHLGQLQRGDTVPEFEQAIFGAETAGVLPRLVRTRYGFHVVRIGHRVAGEKLDFAAAQPRIAARLRSAVEAKAAEQYVRLLAGKAHVIGIDLGAATSALMQ